MGLADDQKTLTATRERAEENRRKAAERQQKEGEREAAILTHLQALPAWEIIDASAKRLIGIRAHDFEAGTLDLTEGADVRAVFAALPPVHQVYWRDSCAGFCPVASVHQHKHAAGDRATIGEAGLLHLRFDRLFASQVNWWTKTPLGMLQVNAPMPRHLFAYEASRRDRAGNATAYEVVRWPLPPVVGRFRTVNRGWYSGSSVQESAYTIHFESGSGLEEMTFEEGLTILDLLYKETT